jgi:hypothetical protein
MVDAAMVAVPSTAEPPHLGIAAVGPATAPHVAEPSTLRCSRAVGVIVAAIAGRDGVLIGSGIRRRSPAARLYSAHRPSHQHRDRPQCARHSASL